MHNVNDTQDQTIMSNYREIYENIDAASRERRENGIEVVRYYYEKYVTPDGQEHSSQAAAIRAVEEARYQRKR